MLRYEPVATTSEAWSTQMVTLNILLEIMAQNALSQVSHLHHALEYAAA